MTRAYAYVFQRPLNYLMYAVIAMLFGGFCWLIVAWLSGAVEELGYWSTSWGANLSSSDTISRIDLIRGVTDNVVAETENGVAAEVRQQASGSLGFAQDSIKFWNGMIRTLAVAFLYGLFWCMASAIYLLLRKDVDDTEMDEIYIVDERRTYELPPLKSDENGVPQVQTPTPTDESSTNEGSGDKAKKQE